MGIGGNRAREGDEGGQGREYEKVLRRLNLEAAAKQASQEDSDATPPEESELPNESEAKKKRKRETLAVEAVIEVTPKVHAPRPMAYVPALIYRMLMLMHI